MRLQVAVIALALCSGMAYAQEQESTAGLLQDDAFLAATSVKAEGSDDAAASSDDVPAVGAADEASVEQEQAAEEDAASEESDVVAAEDDAQAAASEGERDSAIEEGSGAKKVDEDATSDDSGAAADDVALEAQADAIPTVRYRAHVQRIGWQDWYKDGAVAGTSGQSLRMEAFRIELRNASGKLVKGISYQTHVQRVGWQDWVSDGELGGTEGQSLRVEAIRIRLSDELAQKYDVWYCMHIQTYGWLGWAKNGEAAGSAGKSRRVEALRVCLVPKGDPAPEESSAEPFVDGAAIVLDGHVQRLGWVSGSNSVGTVGQGLRMEAIKARISGTQYEGSVCYSAHVQGIGWQDEVADGKVAGTEGQSKRVEAITMRLTGDIADHYDVWYRLHVQTYGWLDWACNGAKAGTAELSRRAESIEVQMLPKGSAKPSSSDSRSESFLTKADVAAQNGQALADANAAQRRIVQAARTTAAAPAGYCAQWVCDVYYNAGYGRFYGDACDLYDRYCTTSDLSKLKVGMIVACSTHPHTSAGSIWGHVGIFVGDGKVLDSVQGSVRTSNLTEWIEYYSATVPVKWGWLGNVNVA